MFLKKNLYQTKDIILKESYYRILPFRVWNHLFLCERYQHVPGICMYCTKLYIQNKKISDFINKDLRLSTVDFPPEITFLCEKDIFLFAYTNAYSRKIDLFGTNLVSLYYESVSSPFLLWKYYLDILCRIVFNYNSKHILAVILSGIMLDCRKFTVCSIENCANLKKEKVRVIFYREIAHFCKTLAEVSCQNVDPLFIIDAFNNYKRGIVLFSCYLEINKDE